MEFRINAEDPVTFAPHPGRIREFNCPGGPGVRVDTAAYRDYIIPPHYDSLIAKLIVKGKNREETLARGRRALDLFIIEGVKTSIPLHRAILDDPRFIRGDLSTRFMEEFEW
jgi:acetyl-CoA carboxylase biotin carboxylase subunit